MNTKTNKLICGVTLFLISGVFATRAQAQSVTFTWANGTTVADLSALGGTVTSKAMSRVGVFIGRTYSDDEWNGVDRWSSGPTGRWLTTQLRKDGRWRPRFTLPSGAQLPNGT